MKSKTKIIVAFILGGIIFSGISVFATIKITADQIEYAPNVSVKDKIDDLYTKVKPNYTGSTTITPSKSTQTLNTSNKILDSNITINPIPSTYKSLTTTTTVDASSLLRGVTAYDSDGNLITGNFASNCISGSFIGKAQNKQLIEDKFAPTKFSVWFINGSDYFMNAYDRSLNSTQLLLSSGQWYNFDSTSYIIENNSLYAGSNFNNKAYIGKTIYYIVCE